MLNCIDETRYLEKVFIGLDIVEAAFFVAGAIGCGNKDDVVQSFIYFVPLLIGIYATLNKLFQRLRGFRRNIKEESKNKYAIV